MIKTDVLVIGGGTSGVIAAVASARNGAETVLVEKANFVGGNAAIGLPFLAFHNQEKNLIVKGIGFELIRRLQEAGYASEFVFDPIFNSIVGVNPAQLKYEALKLLHDSGVKLLLHTYFGDCETRNGRIEKITVYNKSGEEKLEAQIVIDTTGDGDVAARAGAPYVLGREGQPVQAATLISRINNVDFTRYIKFLQENPYEARELLNDNPDILKDFVDSLSEIPIFVTGGLSSYVKKAAEKDELKPFNNWVVMVVQPWANFVTLAMSMVPGVNATDADDLTKAEITGMEQIRITCDFLRSYIPGFESLELIDIAPWLGIRGSRQILGEYVLKAEDVRTGKRFTDSVAMGSHPIDVWDFNRKKPITQKTEAYTIPYRSLVPKKIENLLVAGRCLSATYQAAASARIMPTCMATGEAVGTAAALALEVNSLPRAINTQKLQERLLQQGAIISS